MNLIPLLSQKRVFNHNKEGVLSYTWRELKDIFDSLDIPDDICVDEVTLNEPSDENKIVVVFSTDGKRCIIET